MTLRETCGQLIIGGFAGTSLPDSFSTRLGRGELGGAILFARNITTDLAQIASLCGSIARARSGPPPIASVDQEGGRVARIKERVLELPPAMKLGALADSQIAEIAATLGRHLKALGFNMDYAPVLDVHTNPKNPVIGDRAFGVDTERVASAGVAFARGLVSAGVAACGKHFPGHGDTLLDSHLALPRVSHDRARLRAVELLPFERAARELPAIMSAHVVYDALDEVPATLSKRIATDMLRGEMGFEGVLISDDLEMRAISATYGIADAAARAVEAGCDALLICSDERAQVEAHEALVRRAESSGAFRARCEQGAERVMKLRSAFVATPLEGPALDEALRVPADVARALAEIA